MLDLPSNLVAGLAVLALALALALALSGALYPRRLPGIPYNHDSARRFLGDVPALQAYIARTDEATKGYSAVTTERLGSPIAQLLLPFFRRPLVILDDPLEAEDIFLRRNREFDRSPLVADTFRVLMPHGTLSQFTTPALRAQKRLWADAMSPDFLRRVVAPRVRAAAVDLAELWQLKASPAHGGDEPFDVSGDLACTALDAIYVAVLGTEPGAVRDETKKLREKTEARWDPGRATNCATFLRGTTEYVKEAAQRGLHSATPHLTMWLETLTAPYREYCRTTRTELNRLLRAASARFQRLGGGLEDGGGGTGTGSDADTCAMDLVLRRQLLAARKAGRPAPDPTKDPALFDELLLMLMAGHDSTACAMGFFVRYMERYPDVQAKLRRALGAAFPGPDLPSTPEMVDAMIPYLDAVVEEMARASAIVAGVPRRAIVDTQILGCPVPRGTDVFCSVRLDGAAAPVGDETRRSATSRAGISAAAGRDLDQFRPERWLTATGEAGAEVFDPHALPSLVFGGGFRGCFGKRLAMLEMRIFIVVLLLRFEFLPLPEELRGMKATEKVFRRLELSHARLRVL